MIFFEQGQKLRKPGKLFFRKNIGKPAAKLAEAKAGRDEGLIKGKDFLPVGRTKKTLGNGISKALRISGRNKRADLPIKQGFGCAPTMVSHYSTSAPCSL
jgi:hypothetical protein